MLRSVSRQWSFRVDMWCRLWPVSLMSFRWYMNKLINNLSACIRRIESCWIFFNLYKRRHPTTPHLVWPPLGPNDDLLRLILLSVIFFYHRRSTTEWEFSKKMCTGHQYKEHLWKINSQRRVADGIDGQYTFWFSWKLIFSTSAKMQTSKRKLKSTTQDVSNVNGCKRKINEKMPFLNIANILLTFFSVQKPYCNGK